MSLWIGAKTGLRRFYSGWEAYVRAGAKFLLACGTLGGIAASVGSHPFLEQPAAIVLAAALCSLLPANALLLASAVYLTAGFFQISLVNGLVGGVLLLAALLLYLSFLPGQPWVVICTGLGTGLGIPLCVPMACGLLGGPGSIAGICLGTMVSFISVRLGQGAESGAAGLGGEALDELLELFGAVWMNPEMVMTLVILSAVCLVVYLIRRLPIAWSWTVGVGGGALVYGILRGMEWLLLGTFPPLPLLAADLALGIGTGLVLKSFCFSLDYRKVQYLQFEDDEYYYYVKAVPKLEPLTKEDGTGENPAAKAKREMT